MSHVKLSNLELGQIGRDLIADPSKHLGHLSGWPIVYVFEGGWKGEKELLFGRVSMKSHLQAVALRGLLQEGEAITCDNTEKCFLIEVNEDFWNLLKDEPDVELLREQQMYHLLCACVVDDNGVPKTVKPDIRLYTEEVSVYGESSRTIEMLLKRLKGRRATGADGSELPFNDVELDAEQWKRAGWISDRLVNPKGRWLEGTAPGLLELPTGEKLIPTMADMVRRPGAEKPERYLRALLVSEETDEEKTQAPELPFDSRWPSAGMRLRFKASDGDKNDEDGNGFPLVRVREVDFRLFAPAELQPTQTTIFDHGAGIDSVTISAGGKSVTLGKPAPEEDEDDEETVEAATGLSLDERATAGALKLAQNELQNARAAENPLEIGEVDLRVTPNLFETAITSQELTMAGVGGTIFRHGGGHFVVWKSSETERMAHALRVKGEHIYKEPVRDYSAYGETFIGMRVFDIEEEPWIIVSDNIYKLVDPSAVAMDKAA